MTAIGVINDDIINAPLTVGLRCLSQRRTVTQTNSNDHLQQPNENQILSRRSV